MKIPLGFLEDSKRANHWHISNSKGALCGAEDSGTDWHLPDESFQKINLCLDCWEVLSESAAEHPDPTLHDLQENNWGEGDGS